MARSGIVAAGNWVVDRVKLIERYPEEETLVLIEQETRQNGGGPFNLLVDLALLGAQFPLWGIGAIGADPEGEFVLKVCGEHGIDASRLTVVPVRTSYTDVMTVGSTGRRTFFHHHGANAYLDLVHFDFADLEAAHFHLAYLLLLERLDRTHPQFGTRAGAVLAAATGRGMTTSVDLVSDRSPRFPDVVLPTLPHVDIAFMNEIELSQAVGKEVSPAPTAREIEEATDVLFRAGLRQMAVLHTAAMACVRTADGRLLRVESAAVPAELVKGTVGAGDAFAAGFLFALQKGHSVDVALTWGRAAGATCLRGEGASNGILPIDEALAFACRH